MYFVRFRFYASALGTFVSRDPVEQVNLYQYVSCNPLCWVDPFGVAEGAEPPSDWEAQRHHWFPREGVTGEKGQMKVNEKCPLEGGVCVMIDDFTTPVYNSQRGTPHYYLTRGGRFDRGGKIAQLTKYQALYDDVWTRSANCCDLLLNVAELIIKNVRNAFVSFFPHANITASGVHIGHVEREGTLALKSISTM